MPDVENATPPPSEPAADAVQPQESGAADVHAAGTRTQRAAAKPKKEEKEGFFARTFGRRTTRPTLTAERVVFNLDDNKHLDLSRTQPETLERLKTAFSTKEARQALGLVQDNGEPATPRPSVAGQLVSAVNLIAVQLAANTWKLTDDQARLLLLHEDKTKDVDGRTIYQNVTQLTDELLDKYFPGGFGDYDKELSLLLLLFPFVMKGVQQISQEKSAGSGQTAAAAAGPRPVPRAANDE